MPTSRLRVFLSRIRALFKKTQHDGELSDEIQAHLDLLAEEHLGRGLSRRDACAAARRDFGGIERMKDTYHDQRRLPFFDTLAQDVRYGLRQLRRNPAFAAVAILTFAIGIGANTAVFTLIDALLLRWLPVRDPHQLVQLIIHRRDEPQPGESFSYPLARALAEETTNVFSGLFGANNTTFTVGAPDALERARGAWVTGPYYETLGLRPEIGRLLRADDDRPGAIPAGAPRSPHRRAHAASSAHRSRGPQSRPDG